MGIDLIYRYVPGSVPPPPPGTPAEARACLCAGNREFVGLMKPCPSGHAVRVLPFDPSDLGIADSPGEAPRQEPFAAVLGCSDARVPTEMIFGQACNALFVVRVAGNVLGNECLGSLDYAVAHLGKNLKLLVVLGHSGCGAVTAAVDAFLDPARYLSIASSHPLRAVVDRIFVSVRAAAYSLESVRGIAIRQMEGYRKALVELSVILNAAMTAKTLQREFRHLPENQIQVVYSVYDLASREVTIPSDAAGEQTGLFDPPTSSLEFTDLGARLAGSAEIARLLGSGAVV